MLTNVLRETISNQGIKWGIFSWLTNEPCNICTQKCNNHVYGCFKVLINGYDIHKNRRLHNVQQHAVKIIK